MRRSRRCCGGNYSTSRRSRGGSRPATRDRLTREATASATARNRPGEGRRRWAVHSSTFTVGAGLIHNRTTEAYRSLESHEAAEVSNRNAYHWTVRGPADVIATFRLAPAKGGVCESWLMLEHRPPVQLIPHPTDGGFLQADCGAAVVVHLCAGQWPCIRHASSGVADLVGLRVIDEIVMWDGRWRSVRCVNFACCPANGGPI
jgi:hypothetical protein